ncbi:MAG TPA: nucleoside recognition domain-containing protein [Chthoniobacterales bacterium]
MLNYIWLGLIVASTVLCAVQLGLDPHSDIVKQVGEAAFAACKTAVMDIALPLTGIMALWLGIMRLAEKSGMVEILAHALRPIMRRLFPDVPTDHPAMGSMIMNIAANMLGLGNSATALGLRAMKDLETLNRRPGTATNAMCTFLAINTSSVQLIPATTVTYLAAAGSKDPTAIIGPAFLATTCAATAAIIAVKFLERLPGYRLPPLPQGEVAAAMAEQASGPAPATIPPLPKWGWLVLTVFFGIFAWIGWVLISRNTDHKPVVAVLKAISLLAIPFMLSFFPLFAALKRIPVYEEFVEGAKEGFQVIIRIIPYLVAILVAIAMFKAAGGIQLIGQCLGPALTAIGFPVQLLPLVLIRPLSGSGASGVFNDLIRDPSMGGPDSLLSHMAGCIMGSTETTFYVLAVYFGSVSIRRTRHAVPAGLIADLTGVIASIVICRLVFA